MVNNGPAPPMAPVAPGEPMPGGASPGKPNQPSTPNQDKENAPNDYMVGIPINTRYWAHPLRKGFTPAERVDLTETVLFSSSNRVKNGVLKGQFRLSDLITKFRITVNAIDTNGVIGYKRTNFQSNKPLYVAFDVPSTMTVSDKIKVNVRIGNLNGYSLNVKFTSAPPSDGGIDYQLPVGTFTLRARTSITK